MRKTRNCTSFLIVTIVLIASQAATAQSGNFSTEAGTWQFANMGKIIKCTFSPKSGKPREQVSNAVLRKPTSGLAEVSRLPQGFSLQQKLDVLQYFDSSGYSGFRFRLAKGEQIFGTGERSVPLNRRGYHLELYNQPNYGYGMNTEKLNYSVPFIISSKGYGLFFDNPSRSYLDIGKKDAAVLEYGAYSGELTFYFIPGKSMKQILQKYQYLTGTQPLPARWVFGNLVSRFGYRSEAQLMSIVDKMRAEAFPLDAVILDLFWFGDSIKGTMGNLDWTNSKAWPAPKKMISDLKSRGINTVLITEPYILNTTPNYTPSLPYQAVDITGHPFLIKDFYFGEAGLLDLFREESQNWFWAKYKKQIDNGVAGWWGDLGEPERHPSEVFHHLKDLGFPRLFKADEVHNIYGHYWDKMLFDRYAREYPKVRLFNLNRSGYSGSPRYGVFPWSGDVGRTWSGLAAQLPVMLGMSMSGVPYIHADAGGFAGGTGDKELYTRWIQFAAFTPVLRPHGTALDELDAQALTIPSEGALYPDPYKSIARKYVQLRYRFLPYNYTLGYEQAKWGSPLVRPMCYENFADSNLLKAGDQYMWGSHVLVAPVLEQAAASRKVYFPAGRWYDMHTGKATLGNGWKDVPVTLENIPVYIKAGTFLPLWEPVNPASNTSTYDGKALSIYYYPSNQPTSYTLFDDDGRTNGNLASGKYELIRFAGFTQGGVSHIKIEKAGKQGLATKTFTIQLPAGMTILSAMVNHKNLEIFNNRVTVEFKGKPLLVKLVQ